ncbi:MAG: glycoside hydrolase family 43 protein [Candidatus Methylacidiphilales bacterium]|nr:glycoside hydrolase family 43 protein [Candidatus Methylacidiphilales bacterium]
MFTTQQIQIRDPYIVPVQSEDGKDQRYYMFGTTGTTFWNSPKDSGFDPTEECFDAFSSTDLQNWDGPFRIFTRPPDFWADHNFWAPEVHQYQGRWYMFASFKALDKCRGTQILVSDNILGPYVPHSDGPVTPHEWECLDGTLFIDKAGMPWMVFCHEWVQVQDGKVCAMQLSPDLRQSAGEPVMLFRASEAPWTVVNSGTLNRVTDGPFLHRTESGALLMLWSSVGARGYAIGYARSVSGDILGPWMQEHEPVMGEDGGHGMLFRTFGGQLMCCLHCPNVLLKERPMFLAVVEDGASLRLMKV